MILRTYLASLLIVLGLLASASTAAANPALPQSSETAYLSFSPRPTQQGGIFSGILQVHVPGPATGLNLRVYAERDTVGCDVFRTTSLSVPSSGVATWRYTLDCTPDWPWTKHKTCGIRLFAQLYKQQFPTKQNGYRMDDGSPMTPPTPSDPVPC